MTIFAYADSLTALMLAAGLFSAYLFDRRLAALRWWAGFYVLIAASILTMLWTSHLGFPLAEAPTWACLYAAVAIVAYGAYREGDRRIPPYRALLAGAVLLAVLAATLAALGAPPAVWMLAGPVPTLLFLLWSLVRLFVETPRRRDLWTDALALCGGMAFLSVRSVWFATSPFASPAPMPSAAFLPSLPPPMPTLAAIEPPLMLFLATIFVMVGLAVALVLRVSLEAVDQMRQRSSTDAMSGLLNRATFEEEAIAALAVEHGQPLYAVIFDIDHFKRINDTAGHAAGDRVIARLGALLRQTTEAGGIPGRIGGDEFATILPGATVAAARHYAESVRAGFAASSQGAEVPGTVTLSAGMAQRLPGEPLHALLARADAALYAAKHHGRNRVMFDLSAEPAGVEKRA